MALRCGDRQTARLQLFIATLVLSAILGCKPVEESIDKRSSAPNESNNAIPAELEEELANEGLEFELAPPVVTLQPRQDANILNWEPIAGADRYDVYVAPAESLSIEQAIRIEGVVSPYTHIKETTGNYIYAVVALNLAEGFGSEPSALVNDIPSGYLQQCLSYEGEARLTIDAAMQASPYPDCYLLAENIEAVVELDLSNQGLVELSPLSDFLNLQSLDLSANQVTSLQALSPLVALQRLLVADNPGLDSLLPIATAVALEEVSFSNTAVADISPLQELASLRIVRMQNTPVSSLAALANLPLLEVAEVAGSDNVVRNETDCPSVSVPETLSEFCLQGVSISYAEQISKMMNLHCTTCHNVNNALRANLDNEMDVVANAAVANARIQDGTMPPGAPLSESDKSIFQRWLDSLPPPAEEDEED